MLWVEYQSNNNALRLHMCFELNRMVAVDFIVGPRNSSERNALRKTLVSYVTCIAERGYMCFQLFHDILKSKSNFVFRVKSNLVYSVIGALPVQLPAHVACLFQNVRDELILCNNDPHSIVYRLVRFQIGKEEYFLLTARVDLTAFQVIILYAYRWQIELIFRFLKRTMNGIHLIKQDERGVTIQFYALLITAMLELNLKQQVLRQMEEEKIQETSSEQVKDISEEKISDAQHFFKMIGGQLKKYWKIGIHWLTALRALLDKPFDDRAIRILGSA